MHDDEESYSLSNSSSLESAHAIPIKQRLYQKLLEMEDNSRWEALMETPTKQQSDKKDKSSKNTKTEAPSRQNMQETNQTVIPQAKSEQLENSDKKATTLTDEMLLKKKQDKNKKKREKRKQKDQILKNQTSQSVQEENSKQASDSLKEEQKAVVETEEFTPAKPSLDSTIAKQIKQEQNNIQTVRELMFRSKISAADNLYRDAIDSQNRKKEIENDLFRDSILMALNCQPPSVHGFSHDLPLHEELMMQKRRQEERVSLLSGEYMPNKYPEEFFQTPLEACSELSDPTIMPDRPQMSPRYNAQSYDFQRAYGSTINEPDGDVEMIDETNQSTSFAQMYAYAGPQPRNQNEPTSLSLEMKELQQSASKKAKQTTEKAEKCDLEANNESNSAANELAKKKKKRKNKKKKNKPETTAPKSGEPLNNTEDNKLPLELSDIVIIDAQEKEPQQKPEPTLLEKSAKINNFITMHATYDPFLVAPVVPFEDEEAKKIIEGAEKVDRQLGKTFEDIESLTEEMTQHLIHHAILSQEEEDEGIEVKAQPPPVQPKKGNDKKGVNNNANQKKGSKNKKGGKMQQQQQVAKAYNNPTQITKPVTTTAQDPIQKAPPKLSKKQQKLLQRKNKAQETNQTGQKIDTVAQSEVKKEVTPSVQIEKETQKCNENQEEEVIEEDIQLENDNDAPENISDTEKPTALHVLNNENLMLLQKEQQENDDQFATNGERQQSLDKHSEHSRQKMVGFIERASPLKQTLFVDGMIGRGYHSSSADDQNDNVRIPKRGSSRGSSCTEEVIHQNTISNLGELFPQQYKNPSDDTKQKISKITNSSSNASCSGSNVSSPDVVAVSHGSKKQPHIVSKFTEEPYGQITNQNHHAVRGKRNQKQAATLSQQHAAQPVSSNSGPQLTSPQNEKLLNCDAPVVQKLTLSVPKPQQSKEIGPDLPEAQQIPSQTSLNYDQVFKEAVKAATQTLEEEKAIIVESTIVAEQPEEKSNCPQKGKKKGKQGAMPTVKEMKERGAIARPSDIENAAHQKKTQQTHQNSKKNDRQKQQNNQAALQQNLGGILGATSSAASGNDQLIPSNLPTLQNIQRSQTPNIEALQSGEALVATSERLHHNPNFHGHHQKQQQNTNGSQLPNQHGKNQKGQTKQNNSNKQQTQGNKRKGINIGGSTNNQSNSKSLSNQPLHHHHMSIEQQLQLEQQQQFQAFLAAQQQSILTANFLAQQQQQQNATNLLLAAKQQLPRFQQPLPHPLYPQIPQVLPPTGFFTNQDYPTNYDTNSFQTQSNTTTISSNSISPALSQDDTSRITANEEQKKQQMEEIDINLQASIQQQQQQNLLQANPLGNQRQQQNPLIFNQFQSINLQFNMPPNQHTLSQQFMNHNILPNFQLGGNSLDIQQQMAQLALQNQIWPQGQNTFDMQFAPFANLSQPFCLQQMINPQILNNPLLFSQPQAANFNAFLNQGFGLPQQPSFTPLQHNFLPQAAALPNMLPFQQSPFIQGQAPLNPPIQQTISPQPGGTNIHKHSNQSSPSLHHNTRSYQPNNMHQNYQYPSLGGHHSSPNLLTQNQQFLQNIISDLAMQQQSNQMYHNSGNTGDAFSRSVSHISQDQYEEQIVSQEREENFFQKLDQEIYKLTGQLKMKLQLIEPERLSALRRIEQQVKESYPECSNTRVQVYGSMATRLAIDSSDMDLLVSGVFTSQPNQFNSALYGGLRRITYDRGMVLEQMKRLYCNLLAIQQENNDAASGSLKECLQSVNIIETASVPVIKLVIDLQKIRDSESKNNLNRTSGGSLSNAIEEDMRYLKIDITFNDQPPECDDLGFTTTPAHLGIQCCQFILQKLDEYPPLESLTLVLKKFLALRNLNSPFHGGLNSYGLIILIVTFLNLDYSDNYSKENIISPARALKNFLYFFGKIFDPNIYMITEQQQTMPHLNYSSILIIKDPLNPINNIGKSTFNFDTIRTEFSKAHDKMNEHFLQYIRGDDEIPSLPQADITQSEQITDEATQQQKSNRTSPGGGIQQQKVYKKKLNVLSKIIQVEEQQQMTPQDPSVTVQEQMVSSPIKQAEQQHSSFTKSQQ